MNYLKKISFLSLYSRCYSQPAIKTMRAWQTNKYGSPEDLQLNVNAPIPIITKPMDVLVEVHAASLNPIDVMMLKGYGASVIGVMRQASNFSCSHQEFPLTLGRDFSGTVISTGKAVTCVQPGDEVWGVTGPQASGSHADCVVAHACCISHKPRNLEHLEASCVPYAALTAWAALSVFGRLSQNSAYGKRTLVMGGSGGVGIFAVQILRAWGADVTATCSTDAVQMVKNLGANEVIDYKVQDIRSIPENIKGFDFILDNLGSNIIENASSLLKPGNNSKYVTVVSPLLSNADHYGLPIGTAVSVAQAFTHTIMGLSDGYSVRWAYFIPDGSALKTISSMVEKQEVTPVIDQVFQFEDVPLAYRKVLNGHARGKTIINNKV